MLYTPVLPSPSTFVTVTVGSVTRLAALAFAQFVFASSILEIPLTGYMVRGVLKK